MSRGVYATGNTEIDSTYDFRGINPANGLRQLPGLISGLDTPALARARSMFAAMAERLVAQLGCSRAPAHAVALMALIEGLVENQLLHPATRLDEDELREALALWLSAC